MATSARTPGASRARRTPMPDHVDPMLAKLAELPEDDDCWAFEVKWDGVRGVAWVTGGELRIESRNQLEMTPQFPDLAGLAGALGGHDVVLDGEVVAFDERGRPSFQLLQQRLGLRSPATIAERAARLPVTYVAFDVLHLDGEDLRALPYVERRAVLDGLGIDDGDAWRLSHWQRGGGPALLAQMVQRGMEGVMAKRLDSPYVEGGRSGRHWRKVKQQQRQEFVVGGWTEGAGKRAGSIGALLLGYYDDEGRYLTYAGSVGTGFGRQARAELEHRLAPLARDDSPFDINSPGTTTSIGKWQAMRARGRAAEPARIHYVEPELVCEVEFTEFTRDGTLRHPSFQGLRTDKSPRDVVRETAATD